MLAINGETGPPCGVPFVRVSRVPSGISIGAFSQRSTYSRTHFESVWHATARSIRSHDSRRTVETLAARLRDRGTQTFVSHSSLSVDERRQAEQAFVEARDDDELLRAAGLISDLEPPP